MTAALQVPQMTPAAWWVLAAVLALVFVVSLATVWPHGDAPTPAWPERTHRVLYGEVIGYDRDGEPVIAPHRLN